GGLRAGEQRGDGGGGGSLSHESPNFGRNAFETRGGGDDGGSDLSPGRSGRRDLPGVEDVKRLEDHGRDAVRDAVRDVERRGRGRGGDDDESDVKSTLTDTLSQVSVLTQARQQQARELLTNHRDVVEPDNYGRPVVRGEILALAPSPAAVARAEKAGFRVRAADSLPALGVQSVVLMGPRGISAVEALRRLKALDPQGQYDFNHLYQPSGAVTAPAKAPAPVPVATAAPSARGVRVGLVDGAVAKGQPALSGANLVQKAFAPGGPRPTAHATAVASLIAGRRGPFRGAAPGATLYVADVYGTTPTGGSAEAIVRALSWLAQARAPVINISLVGPPNILLEAAVKALVARGHLVVAAVGNDGPAAPPLYPAAYPGVVAVTGVDPRRRLLPEAGRGPHVEFAAPGSEMAAAGLDGGFVSVRGTSFAAPIAAGLLARYLPQPDVAGAERAKTLLGRQALDLGGRGHDPLYGRGLVGAELRTPPAEVQAKYALRGP
ncbi:MAG: hypothetical protein JWP49_1220, partial [Phenylobacterium sp.]|nr:hypothetical protein [Phenylobacterium sp.]